MTNLGDTIIGERSDKCKNHALVLPALSRDGCDIGSWLDSDPDCGDKIGLPKRPLAAEAKPDPAEPPMRYKSSGADDARRILDSGAGGPSAAAEGVSSPPPADDELSWSLSDTIGSELTPARAALRGDRRTDDELGDAGPPLAFAFEFAFACSCFLLERSGTMAEAEAEAEAAAAAAAEAVTMADAGRREPNETRRMCAADDEPAASIMAWY